MYCTDVLYTCTVHMYCTHVLYTSLYKCTVQLIRVCLSAPVSPRHLWWSRHSALLPGWAVPPRVQHHAQVHLQRRPPPPDPGLDSRRQNSQHQLQCRVKNLYKQDKTKSLRCPNPMLMSGDDAKDQASVHSLSSEFTKLDEVSRLLLSMH